mmetsp:Transcript_52434/g.145336  ORF Transcript_52434/g.145336 Transcript_52434/m.145336 type:complete len:210 (+) Transcript_52434:1033-1662(+)
MPIGALAPRGRLLTTGAHRLRSGCAPKAPGAASAGAVLLTTTLAGPAVAATAPGAAGPPRPRRAGTLVAATAPTAPTALTAPTAPGVAAAPPRWEMAAPTGTMTVGPAAVAVATIGVAAVPATAAPAVPVGSGRGLWPGPGAPVVAPIGALGPRARPGGSQCRPAATLPAAAPRAAAARAHGRAASGSPTFPRTSTGETSKKPSRTTAA